MCSFELHPSEKRHVAKKFRWKEMLGRMKLGVKSLSGLLGICSLIGMAIKIKRR